MPVRFTVIASVDSPVPPGSIPGAPPGFFSRLYRQFLRLYGPAYKAYYAYGVYQASKKLNAIVNNPNLTDEEKAVQAFAQIEPFFRPLAVRSIHGEEPRTGSLVTVGTGDGKSKLPPVIVKIVDP